jgi:hypothetical protein
MFCKRQLVFHYALSSAVEIILLPRLPWVGAVAPLIEINADNAGSTKKFSQLSSVWRALEQYT